MRQHEFERHLAASTAIVPPARSPAEEVFITFAQLPLYGVPSYARVHLRRLMAHGHFPRAVLVSPNRIAWRLSDLARWKASRPYAPVPESVMAARNPGH